MEHFTALWADLGVPVAPEKTKGPATVLKFIGVQSDTCRQTLNLNPSKIAEINDFINFCKKRSSCSRPRLRSLTDSLRFLFAAKRIPSGRLFTERMISLLRYSQNHYLIHLNDCFIETLTDGLQFWCPKMKRHLLSSRTGPDLTFCVRSQTLHRRLVIVHILTAPGFEATGQIEFYEQICQLNGASLFPPMLRHCWEHCWSLSVSPLIHLNDWFHRDLDWWSA